MTKCMIVKPNSKQPNSKHDGLRVQRSAVSDSRREKAEGHHEPKEPLIGSVEI